MWLALVMTGLVLITLLFRVSRERRGRGAGSLFFYRLGLFLSILLLGLTAHQGGSMIYGSDHLIADLPEPAQQLALKGELFIENGFSQVELGNQQRIADLTAAISGDDVVADADGTDAASGSDDESGLSTETKVAAGAGVAAVAAVAGSEVASNADSSDVAQSAVVGVSSDEAVFAATADSSEPAGIDENDTVFNQVILPILEEKCNKCHNDKKSKGKLKMHTFDELMAKDDTVVPGDVEASLLSYRIGLPPGDEDDEAMPPEDEEPLTEHEVAILNWWIASGASNETTVADASVPDDLKASFVAVTMPAEASASIPVAVAAVEAPVAAAVPTKVYSKEEIDGASKKIREDIGASLMPVYSGADTLHFTALNVIKDFGDQQLATLEPLSGQLEEINLARTKVTDEGLGTLSGMNKLKRLHLENTEITDAGLEHLASLQSLEYLNLYGTKVTDAGLRKLMELPSLRKLYAWESGITRKAADAVSWFKPELEVNVGWQETAVAAVAVAADAPKAADAETDKKPAEPEVEAEVEAEAEPKVEPKVEPKNVDAPKPAAKEDNPPEPTTPAPAKPEVEQKKPAPVPAPAQPQTNTPKPPVQPAKTAETPVVPAPAPTPKPAPASAEPKVEAEKPAVAPAPALVAKTGPIGAAPQATTANRACLITRKPVDPKFTLEHAGLSLGFADKASMETFQKNPGAFAVQVKLLQNR